jgi:hypothetical protein
VTASDEEGGEGEVDLILEQHIHRGADGRTRRDVSQLEVPASPSRPKTTTTLKPDVPHTEPLLEDWVDGDVPWGSVEEDVPVYDLLKEPRALRESVGFNT